MSAKNFSNRKASEAILKIMRQMGLKTRKPGNEAWIKHGKGESIIQIGGLYTAGNSIQISVTEDGVSFRSTYASFYDWSHRTKSFRRFNQHMATALYHFE